jgi:SAM-dependent methyltransferase
MRRVAMGRSPGTAADAVVGFHGACRDRVEGDPRGPGGPPHNSHRRRFACLLLLAVGALAQGRHPISGRPYAGVMGAAGADWLTRPERAAEEQPDQAIALLDIARGATVADIGAGNGYMTWRLAERVGPTGKVFANDIQPAMLVMLSRNMEQRKLKNVETVLGTFDDPKLPANAVDLVLLVDVYHEFSEPQKMLRRIREALKADGRLVLLEYRGEDPSVPIRPEHKMTVAQVRTELEPEGYRLDRVLEDLPRQHILIFKTTP